MAGGANPWLVSNRGALPAALLMRPATDEIQGAIREALLEEARLSAPFWPPPSRDEIVANFASGEWPTPSMEAAGFVASPAALRTIRQVAEQAR